MSTDLLDETEAEDEGVIRAVAEGARLDGSYVCMEIGSKIDGNLMLHKFNVLRSICRAIVRMQDG